MGEYTDYAKTERYKAALELVATLEAEERERSAGELFDYLYEHYYDWDEALQQYVRAPQRADA